MLMRGRECGAIGNPSGEVIFVIEVVVEVDIELVNTFFLHPLHGPHKQG